MRSKLFDIWSTGCPHCYKTVKEDDWTVRIYGEALHLACAIKLKEQGKAPATADPINRPTWA